MYHDILIAIRRQVRGGRGELDDEDRQPNERAPLDGNRLISVYPAGNCTKFYVITE